MTGPSLPPFGNCVCTRSLLLQAHDRVTRLYDVYCKFVLPYAMLSEAEREQARKDVEAQYKSSSAEEDAIFKVARERVCVCVCVCVCVHVSACMCVFPVYGSSLYY